jgi:Uncharacterized iron-regulated membrane protein
MNWIHSWSGLLFGWLLFAVFLTGTLTVFDNEITYWMQPELLEVSSDARDGDETWPPVWNSPPRLITGKQMVLPTAHHS